MRTLKAKRRTARAAKSASGAMPRSVRFLLRNGGRQGDVEIAIDDPSLEKC
ncbi:MAG: hypothetical protein R3C42_00625 [Parvularculaceae bacterium]